MVIFEKTRGHNSPAVIPKKADGISKIPESMLRAKSQYYHNKLSLM
jgi:hypothetical protein